MEKFNVTKEEFQELVNMKKIGQDLLKERGFVAA
jgi:hypothetical protein